MEALKRHCSSRRGYRSHLTRIIAATKDIIERDPSELTESDYISLADWQKQLDRKKEILTDVDAKIIGLIEEEGELESEVVETEEIKETISQQAAQVDRVLRLYRRTHPDPSTVVTGVTPPQVPTPGVNTEDSTTSSETVSISATNDTLNTSVNSELLVTATHPVISTTHAVTSSASHVAPPPASHLPSNSGATTRLPKLTIPVFSGDPLQWQSFWDCFEAAVHNNSSLSDVQKLSYLRAQLQHDAARVVAGFPLTGVNYEHSVTLLQQRYGQPYKLVNDHMNALLEMHNPTNSSSALQLFYDSVESQARSLSSLGKSRETYGSLLVPIILNKLPADDLARQHSTVVMSGPLMNYKVLYLQRSEV